MTAQIPERLMIDGRPCAMCIEPLSDYFFLLDRAPRFECACSALWRGYVGHWEIVDRRLYLVRIDGRLEDGSEASLATLFPDHPQRVFAHWYSGTLRVPEGRELEYVHAGYASVHERDRLIRMERGVMTRSEVRINGVAPDDGNPIDGYRVGAMTLFPPSRDEGEQG